MRPGDRTVKRSDCRGCTGWGALGVHVQLTPVWASAETLEQGNGVAGHGRNKSGQRENDVEIGGGPYGMDGLP